MIRSIYAGVSGMKNHQIRMDVVGNNIANVNTVGYKSGRTNFQDTLYQTIKYASTSTNPAQAGLGSVVASININMAPGGLQSTGRVLDLAINGSGFFKVQAPDGSEYFTREGVFYIDQNGFIVNSSGYKLVGELRNVTSAVGEKFARVTAGEVPNRTTTSLTLRGTLADGSTGKWETITIDTAGRADINAGSSYTIAANGATKLKDLGFASNDVIYISYTNSYTGVSGSFSITVTDPANQDFAWLKSEFETQADNAGLKEDVKIYFTDGGSEVGLDGLDGDGDEGFGFRTTDYGPGVKLTVSVKDSTGNVKQVFNGSGSDFVNGFAEEYGTGDDIHTIVNKINAKTGVTGVYAFRNVDDKLELRSVNLTQDAVIEIAGDARGYLGFSETEYKNDGSYAITVLQLKNLPVASLSIRSDGVISGSDSKGYPLEFVERTTPFDLAQICLYTFPNQDGLARVDKNLFRTSASSGSAQEGKPDTPGYGSIESGYLEMSNVDLTDEFATMITTQRGYQANARIITVSDSMLEELIQLKR